MQPAPESAPTSVAYWPSGQGVQAAAPGAVANDPALQGVQEEALPGEAVPGAQGTHDALKKPFAEVPLGARPAGHAAHAAGDDAPTALELVPGGQGEHSAPGDALKEPGAQREQLVAPGGDEEPTGHGLHTPVPLPAA